MPKKITMKNIAMHFNVSVATVSKALKDSTDIGAATRKKIQQYAEENHYRPNIFAVNLKKKKTKTIGLILPNILNLYFAKVFSGIEKRANENGYSIITCLSNDSFQKEKEACELFLNSSVDGIILSLAEQTQKKQDFDHLQNIINKKTGLVLFDRITDKIICDKVIVDDRHASYKATKHFIESGRKNIALISIISHTSVGKLRIEGYKSALTDHKLKVDKNLILKISKNDDLETHLKVVLGSTKVDAILCLEETSSIDALEFVKVQGYNVPNDIEIIGFTNGELSKHVSPSITTVSQHGVFMGETALRYMHERIVDLENEFDSPPKIKVIKTNIIERESTT